MSKALLGLGMGVAIVVASTWASAQPIAPPKLPEAPVPDPPPDPPSERPILPAPEAVAQDPPEGETPERPLMAPTDAPSEGVSPDADEPDALDALAEADDHPPFVVPDFSRQPLSPEEEGRRPRHRWVWNNLFAGRINPLGLVNRFQTGWRVQILDQPGALYDDSQASLLMSAAFSPAWTSVGTRLEFQPLTVLRFGVTYSFVGAHGIFDHLQGFDSADEEFDDDTLDDRKDLNQTSIGHYLEPGVLLQAKFGPIAVRNEVKGTYRTFAALGRDQFFWDTVLDVMFPNNGWALSNDADLLWVTDFGLTAGARWTYTNVFYDDDVDLSGPAGRNVPTHRVGPAVLYKFFEDDPPTMWNAPTVGVLAQWWLKHRYRTGEPPDDPSIEDRSTTQALPYILILFIQEGDFLPVRKSAE